ncbi:MAG: hypothetical protein H6737_05085 [Alphaproteobacteria bacterium]|nr:hypothetical protein [Alphaproteobacteria bacterium]
MLLVALALAAEPTAASCGECHAEIYAQWKGSRHAAAASNPVFRASWEHWPNGWCLECHAPSPEQQESLLGHVARPGILQQIPEVPPGDLWRDGVDCATCHLKDGALVTAGAPSDVAREVHAITQDPALGTEAACARCHEFAFQRHTPALPFAYGTALAQATVTEWRGSKAHADGRGCVDCHMGPHGHGFPGAHDEAFVRDALEVTVAVSGGELRVAVAARDVGHAVPTGDPFRRLELWLCATEACETPEPVAWFRRTLERTETSWEPDLDLRVPVDGDRVIELPVGQARFWQLVYRYGDRRFEPDLPAAEVGYPVARGEIPREPR